MPTGPRLEQSPGAIVNLADWELEDNPFSLQGARPKRVFICPPKPPHPFLIGGHRYLFKEPSGRFAPQIWSEIIAYEISRDIRIPVPPAFAALGPGNGSPGVLIEFFYDHPGDVPRRYVDGIELLQGAGFATNFKRGSLLHNVQLSRSLGVPAAKEWWARTIAFDAVIGNVDRHSRNWGILINPYREAARYELAPAFDNGSSLGYNFPDEALAEQTRPNAIASLIRKGHHHCGWLSGDKTSAQHSRLCLEMKRHIRGGVGDVMDAALHLSDHRIDAVTAWCAQFDFPVRFSEARAMFVATQLKARRDALRTALEEDS